MEQGAWPRGASGRGVGLWVASGRGLVCGRGHGVPQGVAWSRGRGHRVPQGGAWGFGLPQGGVWSRGRGHGEPQGGAWSRGRGRGGVSRRRPTHQHHQVGAGLHQQVEAVLVVVTGAQRGPTAQLLAPILGGQRVLPVLPQVRARHQCHQLAAGVDDGQLPCGGRGG